MAGWSSLAICNIRKTNLIRVALASSKNGLNSKYLNFVPVRNSGHGRNFLIRPELFKLMKFKDLFHLYFMLGALPLGAVVLYCHVFIGPAKLAAIPEGYVPKHWEYYEHPITRWIAKILPSPQECYEKDLHKIHKQGLLYNIKELEKKIAEYMIDREDYQAWYYVASDARITRHLHESGKIIEKNDGKSMGIVV